MAFSSSTPVSSHSQLVWTGALNPSAKTATVQSAPSSSSLSCPATTTQISSSSTSMDTFRFLTSAAPLPFAPNYQAIRLDLPPTFPTFDQNFRPIAPCAPIYGTLAPEMKGPGDMPGFYYDTALGGYPYGGPLDLNGARRKNATRETTAALKHWLFEHRKNPYPTKAEKVMLAIMTKMTLTQVSTWFANARRRLKKENKMTWSPRNRPGEEEDEEEERRPGSSLSSSSDVIQPGKDRTGTECSAAATAAAQEEGSPVKKARIWSITEHLSPPTTSSNNRCFCPVRQWHNARLLPLPLPFPLTTAANNSVKDEQ